jgi:hypothetical protein
MRAKTLGLGRGLIALSILIAAGFLLGAAPAEPQENPGIAPVPF